MRKLNWKCSISLVVLGMVGRSDAACESTRMYVPPKGSRVISAGENVIYNGVLYQALSAVGEGSTPPNINTAAFRRVEECEAQYRNGKYADCTNIPESTVSFSPTGPSKYTTTIEGTPYSFKFNCVAGGSKGPFDLETCQVEGICQAVGGGTATGTLECSGALDLPQGNVNPGKYVTTGADGQKHLLSLAYQLWSPTPTSTGVKDEGICSGESLTKRDRLADQGSADCSTIAEPKGTVTGTFLVTGSDGRQHRLTCSSPTWNPTVGSAGCIDEGVCTKESLSKRVGAVPGGVPGSGIVNCQNAQDTSGTVVVSAGRYRLTKNGVTSLYECVSQSTPEMCKNLGTCDPSVKDDFSKLPKVDCTGKKIYAPEAWFQIGSERIEDGRLYKVIESTNASPKDKPSAWQVVGPCTPETAQGELVDCTNFFVFNANSKYCINPRNPSLSVKLDNKGYKLKYCIDKPGVIPGAPKADGWELLGTCKENTGMKDPVKDCSNVLKYNSGSTYKRLNIQIPTQSGKVLDLNDFAVKDSNGGIYKLKNDIASNDMKTVKGAAEWAYDGVCSDETVNTSPVVDCSSAHLMRPGRIISNINEKVTQFVYTNDHNMYGVMEYAELPHSGIPPKEPLMPLGTCMQGTEKGIEKSSNIVDCANYTRWNPRTPYFQTDKSKSPVVLELEGNVYQMKSEYAAYSAPGLNDNQFELIGTCKEGTATGIVEPGPNDFSLDQELGLRICCPDSDCAGYIGTIQCMKSSEFLKQFGVDFCPFVNPQERKGFVDEHWKGSWFDRRNYTKDCASVKESQVMDFYPGVVFPSPGNWPDKLVAPYFDAGLAQFPPLEKMITAEKAAEGHKLQHFFAAFVQTSVLENRCVGAWASVIPVEVGPRGWGEKAGGVATYYYDVLNRIRKNGGDWAVSFGGYNGVELADSEKCAGTTREETVEKIKNAYKHVIEATGVSHINFDIEGGAIQKLTHEKTHWEYRTDALLQLMKEIPHLRISHTFPVLPTGLADDGVAYLDLLMRKGVRNDYILAMTMDYGDAVCPTKVGGKTMFECEKSAMEGLAQQTFDLAKKYNRSPGWNSPADVYPILGSIPMIGQNDVVDEIYTYDDAQKAIEFYKQVDIGVSSYWAITRDRSSEDKEQIEVPAMQKMLDAIKLSQQPKEAGKKGFADSTSDGVTQKGHAFIFTNIFIDHLKNPLTRMAAPPLTI